MSAEDEDKKHHEVEVSISTTAGFYPTEGYIRIADHQKVEHDLKEAKRELNIKDVEGWIAAVVEPSGKRTIDPDKSYTENGLKGKVEIDWGPSEGGGG